MINAADSSAETPATAGVFFFLNSQFGNKS